MAPRRGCGRQSTLRRASIDHHAQHSIGLSDAVKILLTLVQHSIALEWVLNESKQDFDGIRQAK